MKNHEGEIADLQDFYKGCVESFMTSDAVKGFWIKVKAGLVHFLFGGATSFFKRYPRFSQKSFGRTTVNGKNLVPLGMPQKSPKGLDTASWLL